MWQVPRIASSPSQRSRDRRRSRRDDGRVVVNPRCELELFYGGRYFKGDSIRICLTYAGIPFDDIRDGHPKWPEFTAMKASGALPFGQQPVLRVDGGPTAGGVLLGQSTALCRYVAKIADPSLELYPSDPAMAAMVDGILMQDDDMRTGFCELALALDCMPSALLPAMSRCCMWAVDSSAASSYHIICTQLMLLLDVLCCATQTPTITQRGMALRQRSTLTTPTPLSQR
jgi:hypothetical protein